MMTYLTRHAVLIVVIGLVLSAAWACGEADVEELAPSTSRARFDGDGHHAGREIERRD